MRDMRVRLLEVFMSPNDTYSAEQADVAVQDIMVSMLRHNYDLYAGQGGVLATRFQDPATVRPGARVLYTSAQPHMLH